MAITRLTGVQTEAVLALGTQATAYGTAVAASTGDRIRGAIDYSVTTKELVKNPLGSGLTMQDDIIAGRVTPVVSLSGDAGYQTGFDKIAAQFYGTCSNPAEQTGGEGDYLTRMTINPTANNIYATMAFEAASDKVIELPSCAVRSFSTSFDEASSFLAVSAELIGNEVELATSVNTNAVIGASTFADTECVVVTEAADFWINAESGGALSSSDQFDILSYNRTLSRPQDFKALAKGSAGNAAPVAEEIISGTLTITVDALDNLDYFLAWQAGTTYKCRLGVEGTQIGAGDNKAWNEFCPRIKLVQSPQYSPSSAGYNPVTMSFVIMQAAANPTGMDSALPYLELTNGVSANYIQAS